LPAERPAPSEGVDAGDAGVTVVRAIASAKVIHRFAELGKTAVPTISADGALVTPPVP
jgi:hypothetical protein